MVDIRFIIPRYNRETKNARTVECKKKMQKKEESKRIIQDNIDREGEQPSKKINQKKNLAQYLDPSTSKKWILISTRWSRRIYGLWRLPWFWVWAFASDLILLFFFWQAVRLERIEKVYPQARGQRGQQASVNRSRKSVPKTTQASEGVERRRWFNLVETEVVSSPSRSKPEPWMPFRHSRVDAQVEVEVGDQSEALRIWRSGWEEWTAWACFRSDSGPRSRGWMESADQSAGPRRARWALRGVAGGYGCWPSRSGRGIIAKDEIRVMWHFRSTWHCLYDRLRIKLYHVLVGGGELGWGKTALGRWKVEMSFWGWCWLKALEVEVSSWSGWAEVMGIA